jgi:hypothetical protein
MAAETGAGFRMPAPVSPAELRVHLHMTHGVYLESWVTDASMAEAHELAHGDDAGQRWCAHIPHSHSPAPPPAPPEPERTWW